MSNHPTVIVEKIDEKAIIPCKPKSFFDAGWDVYSLERVVIPAGGDALLSTGLRVAIPNGYCIQVNPRSGKATRDKLVIGARIIDAPYRGELKIHIINFGKEEVEISPNDPCAQLLVLQTASILVEGRIEDLNTERGQDGFGSSNSELIKLAKEARNVDLKIGNGNITPSTYKPMYDKKSPDYEDIEILELGLDTQPLKVASTMGKNEASSTLNVLRQRIERGDLKGTASELEIFVKAIKTVVNDFK